MAIKVVTFDVGSTLLFPQPSVPESFVASAKKCGYDIPLEAAEKASEACFSFYERKYQLEGDFWCSHEGCSWIWQTQYAMLCDRCGVSAHKSQVVKDLYTGFLRGGNWGVFADVLPCLEALQAAGVEMAVISNWDRDLPTILDDLGLGQHFSQIFASGVVGIRKPDVRLFKAAQEALGVAPEEILHVGDLDEADGFGAEAAGFKSLIIDRRGRKHDSCLRVVDDLKKVVDFLG